MLGCYPGRGLRRAVLVAMAVDAVPRPHTLLRAPPTRLRIIMNKTFHLRGLFNRGPSLIHTTRTLISVLSLTLAMPAFAGIPADNIAWSARSVQTAAPSAACTAYSGRPIESGLPLNMDTVLKSVGKALLGSALSVTQGYQGTVPNPCARAGL
ncbi:MULTISPECIES: hypothetical protein [Burkholderia]|uniref:hypothetical protein n=1 Tax=Burkholderia TaxID=32008 RepID=UPI001FC8A03B|nr:MULTISPECIES: hypothetical protein [Burkholderia]